MKLKNLGMALVVVLALGAVMASSAFAAASTSDVQLYIGPAPGTLLSGSESISVTGSSELKTIVGTTPLTLKSTETECVGCTVKNEGGVAVATGKLLFKNVTVVSPAVCAVEGGKVETKLLEAHPDYMIAGVSQSYIKFEPEAPETVFAQLKLVKGSGSCPIAGTYNVAGTDFVKTANLTGEFATPQPFTGNGEINKEAGGELLFLGHRAELFISGASVALSGANKTATFATK